MRLDTVEKIIFSFLFLIVGGAVIMLLVYAYDGAVIQPDRAENALYECREMGYESYLSFVVKPLDPKPYGLRCVNPRTDYEITVNDGDSPKPPREGYL